ncbi:MAG: HAD-IIIA family hydrolase [Saprospiraceae bacterium]|nr:HAD-IIIA family hydrolase [Saprospiraceae bacterium]
MTRSQPTLFLDRDGVINVRTPGDYVRVPEMFEPTEGLEEAMRLLAEYFGHIVVVTNQAGIGKGLMTEKNLADVHRKMFDWVQAAGGRIDRAYYCPHSKEAGCRCRKPATGMAWLALADFPDIDFENAWLVGDSASDMEFGQTLGMRVALVAGKFEDAAALAPMNLDFQFDSLLHFARFIARC